MDIIKFGTLVQSYLEFVLKDVGGVQITCYPEHISIRIVVKFKSDKNWHGIQLYMDYTENIEQFDSEMLSIANQIKEAIEYERNGKVL